MCHEKGSNLATKMMINCIGDSHVSFLSGFDSMIPEWPQKARSCFGNIKAYRIGAILAYSLHKRGHKGRKLLFNIIEAFNIENDIVMLCFGEIDCRTQIVKQARSKNISIEQTVEFTVKNYFSVIMEIKDLGFKVWVWNVILPQMQYINTQEYPSVGTYDERKSTTKLFNEKLRCLCDSRDVKFFYIVDEIGNEHYLDEIHLSQKAMPIMIKRIEDMGFEIERKRWWVLKQGILKIIRFLKSSKGFNSVISYSFCILGILHM